MRSAKFLAQFLIFNLCAQAFAGTPPLFSNGIRAKDSVSINTSASLADSKALLDVSSTTKGLLIPRMTTTQQNAISSPTTGLMIFNTTTGTFAVYNGSAWLQMASQAGTETLTNKTINVSELTGTLLATQGGTGVTSIPTSPAASAFAAWDSNSNLLGNNFLAGYATTATAAGTTTLSVSSANQQYFTGSTTQTVTLPVASTLVDGQKYAITNLSSGVVTVQTSGSNSIQAMGSNTTLNLTCSNHSGGTGTASWTWTYTANNTGLASTNPMTTGGDIPYGGALGVPTRLANGSLNQVLTSQGGTNAPVWANVGAATAPTQTILNATGTQTGWLFTISTSSTVAVGDTYTNNSNTYTVQGALTAQSGQVLYMSGTGATSGTALTRATGSGTSSITFSTKIATATYTPPASVLYLHIKMAGGGGGGAGSGTQTSGTCNGGSTTTATAGTTSFWGANVLFANGGAGGTCGTVGGAGGTAGTSGSGTVSGLGSTGSAGANAGITDSSTSNTAPPAGGAGGNTPYFNGAGQPNGASAGMTANANTGSGGGGAGYSNGTTSGGLGSGGGSGGLADYKVTVPITGSIPYIVGTHGNAGGAGTSGAAGGAGADGVIWIDQYFQ